MANKPRVSVQITADSTGYTAAVNKAKGQLIEFASVSKAVSHSAISDVQATSGALRIIDGGIQNNIRSAERFLASIKGVGAAMQFIYPAVGLIAVGALLARGVTMLTEFAKKTKEAGAEFEASFQAMGNSARLSNDELAKTNINLENQIAKLTGKHENVLAAELIEARIRADELADSAAKAAKEMKDLLDRNQAGVLAKVMGSGPTKEVFGNIENFQNLKAGAQQAASDALHNGDKSGAATANAQYQQYIKNERAYLQQQIKLRSGYVKYAQTANGPALVETDKNDPDATSYDKSQGDQTRNLTALRAALNLNYDQSDRTGLDATNVKDSAHLKTVEDAKSLAEKAAAAQRKADEDHLRALGEAFELQKSAAAMHPWETKTNFEQRQRLSQSNFYLGHLNDFKTAEGRKQAFDLGQKPLDEYNTTDTEGRAALQKMLANPGSASGIFAGLGTEKDTQGRLKAEQESISAQAELANTLRETAISQDLQNGTISKYDAAVQMAALHTAAYQLQLEKLQAEAKQIANDPTLNEEQRRAKLLGISSQIGQLGQSRDAQKSDDAQNVQLQTAFGGWQNALDRFVIESKDTASQVAEIWTDALTSVNDVILKDITSKHDYGVGRQFRNAGAGIFKNIAGAGLKSAEGTVLGKLGFGGKADGSRSKPFWVKDADHKVGAPGSGGNQQQGPVEQLKGIWNGISSIFKKSSGDGGLGSIFKSLGGNADDGSSSGDGLGDLLSGLSFADGGQPPVGKISLVGENGPEPFLPTTAGTILPNSALGGEVHHHTISVDARGATDPAMVEAAIRRAAPAIVRASMQKQADTKARKPPSSR